MPKQNTHHKPTITNLITSLHHKFIYKYSNTYHLYYITLINNLIYNKPTHHLSVFKDFLISSEVTEFLRRFYNKHESRPRLQQVTIFYETYSKLFPNYVTLPESMYLYKNIRRKQKMIDAFDEIRKEEEENRKKIAQNDNNNNNHHQHHCVHNHHKGVFHKQIALPSNNNVFTEKVQQSINNYYPSFSVSKIIYNEDSVDNKIESINETSTSIVKMLNDINNRKVPPLKRRYIPNNSSSSNSNNCFTATKTKQKRLLQNKKKIYLNNLDIVNLNKQALNSKSQRITTASITTSTNNIPITKQQTNINTVINVDNNNYNKYQNENTLTHTITSKTNISKHKRNPSSTMTAPFSPLRKNTTPNKTNTLHCATISSINKQKQKTINVNPLSPQRNIPKKQLTHMKSQYNQFYTISNKDINSNKRNIMTLMKSESLYNNKSKRLFSPRGKEDKQVDEKTLTNILRYKYKTFLKKMKGSTSINKGSYVSHKRNDGIINNSVLTSGSVISNKGIVNKGLSVNLKKSESKYSVRVISSRNVGKNGLSPLGTKGSEDGKGNHANTMHWRGSSFEMQGMKKGQKITVNRKVTNKKRES